MKGRVLFTAFCLVIAAYATCGVFLLGYTTCHPFKLMAVCEYIGSDGECGPSCIARQKDLLR